MRDRSHYLLWTDAWLESEPAMWRFLLQMPDGTKVLEAADSEPGTRVSRLELLAAVRGLEAIDAPARVTLFTPSRYVWRGFVEGLDHWRRHDWNWESFGRMTPIRNLDLWQRIDRIRSIHQVECRPIEPFSGPLPALVAGAHRRWRLDAAHTQPDPPSAAWVAKPPRAPFRGTPLAPRPLRAATA